MDITSNIEQRFITIKWLKEQNENSFEQLDINQIKLYTNRLQSEISQMSNDLVSFINSEEFDTMDNLYLKEELWNLFNEVNNMD
jgi:hypothetical protein